MGDFKIFSVEVTDPLVGGMIMLTMILMGFIIFILLIAAAIRYTRIDTIKRKKEISRIQSKDKMNSGELVELIRNQTLNNQFIKMIKIIIPISISFLWFLVFGMALFSNIHHSNAFSYYILGLNFGFIIIVGGILLSSLVIWERKKNEIQKYLKIEKKVKIKMKGKPFKETIILTGRLWLTLPPIIVLDAYIVIWMINSFNLLGLGLLFDVITIMMLFIFIILQPIFLYVSYKTLIVKIDCREGIIIYSNGPVSALKIRSEDIVQIRPVPTSILLDLFSGRTKSKGKWIEVKTGIAIVLKDGKVKYVMTSRPLDIISLLEK